MATVLQSRENIQVAGISSWEIRDTGTDQTWYTIPFLRDVKVTEKSIATKGSRGQSRPYAVRWEASGKMTATGSLGNCLQILDDIASQQLDTKLVAVNGTIWDSKGATGAGAGIYWKLVSDGDMDADRYLEVRMDRTVLLGDLDAFHTAQTNVETGTDAELAKLESIVRADIVPAGIKEIGFGASDYTTYVMKYIRKSKFEAETLVTMDQFGRSVPYAVKIDWEVQAMTADDAASQEIVTLDSFQNQDMDWKLTFADGRTASFDSLLGHEVEVNNINDMDDIQYLVFRGNGVLTFAQFAALWA